MIWVCPASLLRFLLVLVEHRACQHQLGGLCVCSNILANRPLVLQYSSDTEDILGIRIYRGLRTFALLDELFLTPGPLAGYLVVAPHEHHVGAELAPWHSSHPPCQIHHICTLCILHGGVSTYADPSL